VGSELPIPHRHGNAEVSVRELVMAAEDPEGPHRESPVMQAVMEEPDHED